MNNYAKLFKENLLYFFRIFFYFIGGINIPGGNRRGPDNLGPMTGRGFGYCSGSPHPGYWEGHSRGGYGFHRRGLGYFWGGRGLGYPWGGRGRGYFWGPGYFEADLTDEEKMDDLNKSLEYYESNIAKIKEEIEKLKKEEPMK